jgi:hypothetical protein
MTLKTSDTIAHTISKSNKRCQGATYTAQGKTTNGLTDDWKQVVLLTPFGKTVKGKTAYVSQTKHVRAN